MGTYSSLPRKLMLAKINWTFLHKDKFFEENFPKLVDAIKMELTEIQENALEAQQSDEADETDVYDALNNHAPNIEVPMVDTDTPRDDDPVTCEHLTQQINCDFWERHFHGKKVVAWNDFRDKFLSDYGERINRQLGEDKEKWMVQIIYKDVLELRKEVKHEEYLRFSGKNTKANPDHFFERVKSYVVGICAMREVFDMESTMRLIAIQNLGIKPRTHSWPYCLCSVMVNCEECV